LSLEQDNQGKPNDILIQQQFQAYRSRRKTIHGFPIYRGLAKFKHSPRRKGKPETKEFEK
jgi:hypothetical protein